MISGMLNPSSDLWYLFYLKKVFKLFEIDGTLSFNFKINLEFVIIAVKMPFMHRV